MFAETYTQNQILSGIRIFWAEELGCESPFDADMRLDAGLKAEGLWEEIDVYDIFQSLGELFGFTCRRAEWESLLGLPVRDSREWEESVAPRLTFRAIAEFIRARVVPIPLRPLALLGKPCATAGAFRGLEQLAQRIRPQLRPFAPSTPIRERLCARERRLLWSRLRWIASERIPPSPRLAIPERHIRHSFLLKLAAGVLIAAWHFGLPGLLIGLVFGLFTSYIVVFIVAMVVAALNLSIDPLPKGIKTFGDLARCLAVVALDQPTECTSCSTP